MWRDDAQGERLATFRTLRQQMAKPDGRPNVALADFVAPLDTGVIDYVGAFAVTAGHGLDGPAGIVAFESAELPQDHNIAAAVCRAAGDIGRFAVSRAQSFVPLTVATSLQPTGALSFV